MAVDPRKWFKVPLLLLLLAALPALQATERAQSWKPQTVPGAYRLNLSDVDQVILPQGPSDRLDAAVEDLVSLWPSDIARVGSELEENHPDFGSTRRGLYKSPLLGKEGSPYHSARNQHGVSALNRVAGSPEQACCETGVSRSQMPKNTIVLERSDAAWLMENLGSFSIQRERTRVYVRAATDEGLANGVIALCRDLMGARWYWASYLGFEFVGERPEKFPLRQWREAPDFVMRSMRPMVTDYSRRNRLVPRWDIGHALAKVFTPELYGKNPELFSMIKGRRIKPTGSRKLDPQPDFTHPDVVQVAAEAAINFFEEHPESRSFSLSINDNVLFDTSEWTELTVEPVRYFRGRPNYTDLVFGFMNQVAEQVFVDEAMLETPSGQPRYLTALAYYWTEPSPSFELHPRVMPVLTSDRAQWHDSAYREEDMALAERWMASGVERMATWDYYFGAPYPYPRQFTQWMDESLKHLNEIGVDVFFSQLPSAWGMDGPKAWLAAELLWDSQQDVEILLEEYYTNFFGAAAEPMRDFYEMAEAHRNEHEGEAEWIKFYKDEAGIELFTPELVVSMRACIQRAEELVAEDERRAARVQVVSDAFKFSELYAEMHGARVELVEAILSDSEGAPRDAAALPVLLERFVGARKVYTEYAKQLVADPMHSRLRLFTRMMQSDPVLLALTEGFASSAPTGYEGLQAAIYNWDSETAESLLPNVLLRHDGFTRFSFLGPYVPLIDGWKFDFRPSEKFKLLPAQPDQGIRIEGADMSSMFADVEVVEGSAYFLEIECAYSISPDNRTQVQLTWKDANGKQLKVQLPLRFPNGKSKAVTSVTIPMVAPPRAAELRIHFTQSRQYDGDFFELHSVDLKR